MQKGLDKLNKPRSVVKFMIMQHIACGLSLKELILTLEKN